MGSLLRDARTGSSPNSSVRMSPLTAALMQKKSARYVNMRSACFALFPTLRWKLASFLTKESRWTSTTANSPATTVELWYVTSQLSFNDLTVDGSSYAMLVVHSRGVILIRFVNSSKILEDTT